MTDREKALLEAAKEYLKKHPEVEKVVGINIFVHGAEWLANRILQEVTLK